MRKVKSIFLFFICIVSFMFSILSLNAKENSTYTLNVDLNDYNFNVYSGNINYDTNIFEELDSSSFNDEDVEIINYNEENHKFVIIFNDKKDKTLKITFKVKNINHTNSTVITIKDLVSSNGSEDIKLDNKNYEIKLSKNGNIKETNKFDTKNNKEDNDKRVLFFNPITILLSIVFIALIYWYNTNLGDYKNKIVKIIVNLLFIIGLIVSIVFSYLSYFNKSDINKDVKINYDDVNEVINYLLDIKKSSNDISFGFKADVNNDRKLTITDVAEVTTKINSYSITLSDIKIDKYINKNNKFNLTFKTKIIPNEDLSKVEINNQLYDVIKTNDSEYKVELMSPLDSGIYDIVISKFILSNGKKISKEYKTSIDVLKDKPTLTNYKYDSFNNLVLFDLNDEDKSIVSANKKEVYSKEIESGNNEVLATLKNGKYKVSVIVNYDLDNNIDDDNNYEVELLNKEINVLNDYNFKFNTLKLESINNKDNILSISFISTNASTYNISSVKINNEYYNVKQQENKYIVDVPYDIQNKNINIESAKLENQKEFIINEHLILFKNKPTINNLELKLDGNILNATYNIIDTDKVIRDLYIVLKDKSGNIIEKQNINTDSTSTKFNKKLTTANKYIVEIISNYNNYDGKNHDNEVLTSNNFNIEESVKVTSTVNKYVNKNTNFKIKYKFEDNIDEEIKFLYINDERYEANYINGQYEIEFNSSNTPQILTFKLNKVEYSNGLIYNLDHIDTVEVLKDKIKIENYKFEDNQEYPKISFNIKDNDNAFVSGRIILFDENNKLYFVTNIDLNKTKYELKVKDNKTYKLKIEINYILDQNNNEKYNKTEYLFESNIKHIKEYNFKIDNVKLNINNDDLSITFDSTNSSKYNIDNVTINDSTYKVTRNKNSYKVNVKLNNKNMQTINLQNVVLSNGKVFDTNIKNEIFKTKPSVYNFESKIDNNNLVVNFNIKDTMNTITNNKINVVLKDYNNKIIKENTLKINNDELISTTFENVNAGNYIIEIKSTYDLMDGNKHNNEIIYTKDKINVEVTSKIETVSISNYYPKKYENITIKYKITDNTNKEVVSLLINNEIYKVKKEDNYYVVNLSSNESGIHEYKVSKIYYDNLESNVSLINKIDVLKDTLTINDFVFEKLDNSIKFTFDIEDNDNVLKDNNLQIELDNQTRNIKLGKNEIVFSNIDNNKNLTFIIKGNYDLTSGKLDKEYKNSNIIFTKSLNMKDNNAQLSNLKTLKKDYERNEKITLSFNYNSNTKNYPIRILIDDKEYDINKNNKNYTAVIDGNNNIGKNTISNIKIKLDNGEIIKLSNNVTYNILKSKPSIKDFNYEVTSNRIYLNFDLIDEDNTILTNSQIKVTDKNGKTIVSDKLISGKNSNSFEINNINNFKIEITSNYELSENDIYENSVIYKNNIDLNKHYNELKDIDEIKLYYKDNNEFKNIIRMNIDNFNNLDNFVVKIIMKDFNIYSKINSYEIIDNKLKLNLKFDGIIQYENNIVVNTNNISVIFGEVDNNIVTKKDYYNVENTNDLDIPNYERIKNLSKYDSNKDKIYYNLSKLMPFIDSNSIIEFASNISSSNILNTNLINAIIPYDKNSKMMNYLTNNNYKNLSSIKVIFDNKEVKDYNVTFNNYQNGIVSYNILELGVFYNYNKFVINENSNTIKELLDYANKLNYNYDLDSISKINDSKIYSEYYNEVTKKNLKDIIFKFINTEYYYSLFENDDLNIIIKNDFIDSNKLKEFIYTYNYFSRFYNFDINGVNVCDSLLFYNELFGNKTNIDVFVNDIKTGDINTYNTSGFYVNNISSITNIDTLQDFIEFYINEFGDYEDVNDWFTDNYNGILKEINVDDSLEYRAWYHIKRRPNLILPLITIPKNSSYIISLPSQILIGSQKVYITNPNNQKEHNKLVNKVNEYSSLIKEYYTRIYDLFGSDALNRVSDIQIDSNYTLNSKGNKVNQNKNYIDDEFHKSFNYILNIWNEDGNEKVYLSGDRVMWNSSSILNDFNTFVNSTTTNQFNKVYLNSIILRNKNINVNSSLGMEFNLNRIYSNNEKVLSNYTPNRISTINKLNDYYKKVYLTIDFIDYIEANAFLALTPSEQANIAMQVYYPNLKDSKQDMRDYEVKYKKLTEDEIKNLNLKTVNDLIENRIILKSNVNESYSVFDSHWYQPYNSNGVTQNDINNYFAYEMLGYKGYEVGFKNWYNIKSGKTDIDVLEKITGYKSFNEYKIARYEKIDDLWKEMRINISNGSKYIVNPDNIYEELLNTLRVDAGNGNLMSTEGLKEKNYYFIKKNSNDFEINVFGVSSSETVIHISDAKKFVETLSSNSKANIILDDNIDLSGYKSSTSIIKNTFSGSIDGNNKKISGNVLPIFGLLSGAKIENLTIENSNIKANYSEVGSLARVIENSSISNVIIKKANINASKNKKVGVVAGYISNTDFKDVHVINGKVIGGQRVGGLIGYVDNNSNIEECSVTATITASNSVVGLFVGETYESVLDNNYAVGDINVSNNVNDIGGFIGYVNNSQIRYNYTKVVMNTPKNSGGFVGQVVGNADIQNNISFSLSKKGYKFDGRTDISVINTPGYTNNYELDDALGNNSSIRHESLKTKIISINSNKITEDLFINENKLSWSSDIWNVSDVSSGGLPKLKAHDPNSDLSILKEGIIENNIEGYDKTIMDE